MCAFFPSYAFSADSASATEEIKQANPSAKDTPLAPLKVDVNPKSHDYEIKQRLENIMKATGWFENPKIEVKDGVVFLEGTTKNDNLKKWAEDLARNTQDTVAVVNHIEVTKPSIWEYKPLLTGMKEQWFSLLRIIPSIIFGFLILLITLAVARFAVYLANIFLRHKYSNPIIQKFIAWSIGLVVLLLGLYLIFNLMGLTTIAITVIGGTGLMGIILGIAFKEITENFLASLFLSFNNPFQTGDLIEIEGILGYVERLTFRSTILIKLDGTYVQVPNSTVYKSNILNFTSNPSHREDFVISIGYENQITDAQERALKILKEHPAVLKTPEPWVLVDNLGKSVVNLRIYFWINRKEHNWLKVKSSVIRLIKDEFQAHNISMPDEERERVFPEGITVRLASKRSSGLEIKPKQIKKPKIEKNIEEHLQSDEDEIKNQALKTDSPEGGRNLLKKN